MQAFNSPRFLTLAKMRTPNSPYSPPASNSTQSSASLKKKPAAKRNRLHSGFQGRFRAGARRESSPVAPRFVSCAICTRRAMYCPCQVCLGYGRGVFFYCILP